MSANYRYQVGTTVKTVQVTKQGSTLQVTIGNTTYQVAAQADNTGRLALTIDGQRFTSYTAIAGQEVLVWLAGQSWRLPHPATESRSTAGAVRPSSGNVTTPMPGLVTALLVQVGDPVQRGDPLVVLEAMKMEQRLTAPHDGWVRQVACTVGQVVGQGALLVEVRMS